VTSICRIISLLANPNIFGQMCLLSRGVSPSNLQENLVKKLTSDGKDEFFKGNWDPGYFRKIQVGEIL